MSVTQIQCRGNETYELLARSAWQSATGVTPFHIRVCSRNSNRDSKIFNKEFREIYWKIGREEFPEKILAMYEIRDAQFGFSDKTKSYMKSKLISKVCK